MQKIIFTTLLIVSFVSVLLLTGCPAKTYSRYVARGNTYEKMGYYDRAINQYTQAIRLDSESARAYKLRGAAYAKKGDYESAINDFTQAIRLFPQYSTAYTNRGLAYAAKGDTYHAEADFQKAEEIKETRASWVDTILDE
ncbi:MAG: tetratricopeptide repeat protein [Planctomycetaceae bacterium]|jgi:tetratricopeptide (TPR) repeat protein|nr:tetratricopeptide repeat protein [Planctomycetaceae bacterium]